MTVSGAPVCGAEFNNDGMNHIDVLLRSNTHGTLGADIVFFGGEPKRVSAAIMWRSLCASLAAYLHNKRHRWQDFAVGFLSDDVTLNAVSPNLISKLRR